MLRWDYIEEGTAVLRPAADASQFLEADLYPTSSLVVPMIYRLMKTSSNLEDVKFPNRAEDEFNDPDVNPVKVPHANLSAKIQDARSAYHEKLIDKFHRDVARDVKPFWFVASLLDPRFKKLSFKHDGMLADSMRARELKWLTTEFNSNYKGKVVAKAAAAAAAGAADNMGVRQRHLKRRKVSAAAFFADSSDSSSDGEADGDAATGTRAVDELAAYLEVPAAADKVHHRGRYDGMVEKERGELPECGSNDSAVLRLSSIICCS